MTTSRALLLLTLFAAACSRDTGIPDPPDPLRPGTVSGTIIYEAPGRNVELPATEATVELVSSGVSTTASKTDARFTLSPLAAANGTLLFRFDADKDGKVDYQRVIELADINAGPGRDISLGAVKLGANAALRGTVLRADRSDSTSGHGGTVVFVPEGPFTTYTGDNGGFTLENLPPGELTIGFFRTGYDSAVTRVELRGGELLSVPSVLLTALPTEPPPVRVTGTVLRGDSMVHSGIKVTVEGVAGSVMTDSAGRYTFEEVPRGIHSVGFEADGYLTAVLTNLLMTTPTYEVRSVTLVPGMSTMPVLDGGILPFDAGEPVDSGQPDSGQPDSGQPDSGQPDSGQPDSGQPDAGVRPVAIVDLAQPFAQAGTMVTLNAQRSTGDRPLVFSWRQDAGTTVNITNNDTPLAATPTFTAPSTAQVLRFSLVVTDTHGVSSLPTNVTLPIGTAPIARIAAGYPTTVYAGQHVVLDGISSSDASGSGIASYQWAVNPASLVATPLNGGAQLDIAMPATSVTPIVVSVQLQVTNGLGIVSTNTATASFNLTTASAPAWTLDAGLPQGAAGGATVTLNAGATTPGVTGATFAYVWTPAQGMGSPPDWQLTNPSVPSTTFVAPILVGDNRLLPFTVTATQLSGPPLTPPSQQAQTWVMVQDRTPPSVVATSVVNGSNGVMGVWVDFSEPISSVSVNSVNVTVTPGATYPSPGVDSRIVEGNRLTLVLRRHATPGNSYQLNIANIDDLAVVQNRMPGNVVVPFVAIADPWSPAWESTASSVADARPGVVVRTPPGAGPNVAEALVFGRKEDSAWFLTPFDPRSCTATPCTMTDETGAPTVALGATPVTGRRGELVGKDLALATMRVRDYGGTASVNFQRSDAGWVPFPAAPGQVFPRPPNELYAGYADNGLKIARYDFVAGSWSLADAGVASSNATDFSSAPGATPLVYGGSVQPGGNILISARTSTTGFTRYFQWTQSTGAWASWGNPVNAAPTVRDLRLIPISTSAAWTIYSRTNDTLDADLWGSVNNGAGLLAANSGPSNFDTLLDDTYDWLAQAQNGTLTLRYVVSGAPNSWPTFPGPLRGGMPSNSLNNDPTCWADHPELTKWKDKLFIVWEERCGTGPWKIYLRWLN